MSGKTDGSFQKGLSRSVTETNRNILEHPFHRICGLELMEQEPGKARCRFSLNAHTINYMGSLHGGILYALMDVVSLFALLPVLDEGEHAVTHDVHFSIMRPSKEGYVMEIRSEVIRRGRSIAFIQVEAWRLDGDEESICATGTVTKSIVSA